MNKTKIFKELNLSDDYLFGKVMQDEEILKGVLEKILGFSIDRLEIIEPQKTIVMDEWAKGIRIDIYAGEGEKRVYSVEIQKENEYNIPKRSRYYHSTMDLDLLSKGEKYKNLRDGFVIFICLFDPFGQGRHKYTFENTCIEDGSLKLKDSSYTIILNICGSQKDIDKELLAFFRYIEESTELVAEQSDSELVKLIHRKVREVKESKEREVEFLTLLERDERNIEQGYKKGIEDGIERGIEQERRLLAIRLKHTGMDVKQIVELTGLEEETIQAL